MLYMHVSFPRCSKDFLEQCLYTSVSVIILQAAKYFIIIVLFISAAH